jgi:four helix bundle protein
MYQFAFEKLEAWQLARELVAAVYVLTEKFPDKEKFGLTNQIRRASTSVAANLAEGSARTTAKDQAHFSNIAYSSLIEVLSHVLIAVDLKFANENDLAVLRQKIGPLSLKINNLRNKQLSVSEGLQKK